MGIISFAKWSPDRFPLEEMVAPEAKGVWPSPDSYLPWPQPTQVSAALAAACQGAFTARASDGTLKVFAATTAKQYVYASSSAWTDVTRVSGGDYALVADQQWSYTQFGTSLIASNYSDAMQVIDVDAGTNFSALGGSPPQAKIVRTVGDFVMAAGINGHVGRVHWSGRNNSTFWTRGTQDCDAQDFLAGGDTTGIAPFGQGRGLIFQEGAIRAFSASNDRSIFNFDLLEDQRGLVAPDSLVVRGGTAYYYSQNGFFATDGSGQSRPLGANIVDRWFQMDVNYGRITAMRGAVDPINQRVIWIYPSNGNSATVLDRAICYDIATDAWSHADLNATVIFAAATPAATADNIDTLLTNLGYTLETAPFSFDAQWLRGGTYYLSIFDNSFKLAYLSGTPMAATLETVSFQPIPGKRVFVRGCRLITDNANATVQIGATETASGTLNFTTPSAQNGAGRCPVRTSGRWIRARVNMAAGDNWTHITGVTFDDDNMQTALVVPAGDR